MTFSSAECVRVEITWKLVDNLSSTSWLLRGREVLSPEDHARITHIYIIIRFVVSWTPDFWKDIHFVFSWGFGNFYLTEDIHSYLPSPSYPHSQL